MVELPPAVGLVMAPGIGTGSLWERYRIRWYWTRSRNRYRAYRRDRHETWHRHRTRYRRCCWYQRPDGCQCWALTLGQARSTRRGSAEDQRWSSGTRRRVAGTAEHTQCNDEESDALHEATSSKRDTTWLARFLPSPQLLSRCYGVRGTRVTMPDTFLVRPPVTEIRPLVASTGANVRPTSRG